MSDTPEAKVHKNSTILNASIKPGTPLSSSSGSNGSSSNKPDIKVSADGVAKLNFSFLEEACDSSLEPGEVVTPPQSNSPVPCVTTKTLSISSLAIATNVSASQREAQVCKEKVRAILEIDAKKRKEENEKRKQDLEKRRQSGELETYKEEKRKEKAERKRIKRIEKEQRAARLALMSDDIDGPAAAGQAALPKIKTKTKRITEDRESYESGERLSSSGEEGERVREREPPMRSVVNSVAIATSAATTTFHPTTSPAAPVHMPPDGYGGGNTIFRPMFPRHMRPDFHHGRGGYMLRGRGGGGRGGMNTNIRHPLYRAPFFPGSGPRGHVQYHAMPRQPHPHPHPSRGHSPIMAPAEVRWTKTQPSISYSQRGRYEHKLASKVLNKSESLQDELTSSQESIEGKRKSSKRKSRKSEKKNRNKKTKKKFKLKSKAKEKDKEREKRSTRTENREKSNLRKIVKIRNSFEKGRPITTATTAAIKSEKAEATSADGDDDGASIHFGGNELERKLQVNKKLTKQTEKSINESRSGKSDSRGWTPPALPLELIKVRRDLGDTTPDFKSPQMQTRQQDPSDATSQTPKQQQQQRDSGITKPDFELQATKIENFKAVKEHKNNKNGNNTKTDKNEDASEPSSSSVGGLYDIFAESPPRSFEVKTFETQKLATPQPPKKCESRSNTPPIELLPTTTHVAERTPEKSQLQKAIEMQQRIGKLLQDDDLQPEKLEATKEKLLQKTQNLVYGPAPPPPMAAVTAVTARTTTPSLQLQTNNKRKLEASKTIEKTEQTTIKQSSSNSSEPKEPKILDKHAKESLSKPSIQRQQRDLSPSSSHSTIKRKYSRSPKDRRHKSPSRERKIPKRDEKLKAISGSTSAKDSKSKKAKSLAPKESTRLSFNASEFLFPDDDETRSSGEQMVKSTKAADKSATVIDDDDTNNSLSLQQQQHSRYQSISANKSSNSPDTDDYMDNWELDDPDSPSAVALVESSIEPKSLEKSERYAKTQASTSKAVKITSPNVAANTTKITPDPTAMQDIYDEFIKSVEASGVDVNVNDEKDHAKSTVAIVSTVELKPQNKEIDAVEKSGTPAKRAGKRNLSTSSNSSSSSESSSSSSTSTSESSESSSSAGSSTASSASASKKVDSAVKSNAKNEQKQIEDAVPAAQQLSQPKPIKNTEAPSTELSKPTKEANDAGNSTAPSRLDPVEVLKSVLPTSPSEQQKQQIAKDLKKVKSYDSNLRRTQMMRANFDASDDIFGELAKMEKLFKHAINFIIQKYTKDRQLLVQTDVEKLLQPALKISQLKPLMNKPATTTTVAVAATAPIIESIPAPEPPQPSTSTTTADEPELVNKIFDSNREIIKLTIAPLKLTKPPAIFDKLDKVAAPPQQAANTTPAAALQKHGAADAAGNNNEDVDFTETMVKTTKEVAIVKPMSKSGRSPSPRRSSSGRKKVSPRRSHGRRSNSRSGSAYRTSVERRSRRSTSRSRLSSNQRHARHQRAAASSMSPARRGRPDISPKRRGRNSSPIARYRGRSPMRRSNARRDLSPPQRRRGRQPPPNVGVGDRRHYEMRSYSRSHSRSLSRSRSPGMIPLYRLGGPRPHSPRSPPPAGPRRSYSRDSYSRSPLPFKPPSPPEQDSSDAKRAMSHCRRSRSFSRSPSPRRSRSRSPRSPHSPRSPRSPRSPLSPRPHTPQYEREGSYDMYHRHSQSPPPQHGYFESTSAMAPSAYYYAVPPNMLHNGPDAEQRGGTLMYSGYGEANYDQYQNTIASAYLPQGMPLPHGDMGAEYYAGHFPADPHMYGHQQHQQPLPQNMHMIPPRPNNANFYYNQQMHALQPQLAGSPSYLLKTLRKEGTFAVQKGNVLEIVPSESAPSSSAGNEPAAAVATVNVAAGEQFSFGKPMKPIDPIKEEITMRLQESAKLKKVRKSQGEVPSKSSMIKKEPGVEAATTKPFESATEPSETATEGKPSIKKKSRKKVLFEDGLFPNHNSEDEDEQDAEKRLRLELRRMRKKGHKAVTVLYLLSNRKPGAKQKPTASDLAKLPPPPPPAMPLPRNLEQPLPNRPSTPPHFMFYHFDAVVQALYTSPSERGIPPRLTDPKAAALFAAGKILATGPMIKHRSSPVFNVKRDHGGCPVAALKMGANIAVGSVTPSSSSSRGSSSPQLPPSPFYSGGRRGVNFSFNKHQPPPASSSSAATASSSAHAFSPAMHTQLRFVPQHSSPGSPISTLATQPMAQHTKASITAVPTGAMTGTFQAITPNLPQMPLTPTYGPPPPPLPQQPSTSPPMGFAIGNLQQQPPRGIHPQQQQHPVLYPLSAVNGSAGSAVRPPTLMTTQQHTFTFNPHPFGPPNPVRQPPPSSTVIATKSNQHLPQMPPPSVQNFDAMS